jgi:ethanolamine utilization protein EutN
MRIAEVIGTVTLSSVHPSLTGLRFVIGVPYSHKALSHGKPDGEDLIILDQLSAGFGSRIGFSEGAEAAMPFLPERKPVDAYCACILDKVIVEQHENQERASGEHESRESRRS